jgi:hypothetical protein
VVENQAPGVLVSGEPTYIEQVVQNLLSNADKYSPLDAPVSVTVRVERGAASVAVRDQGPGVPADGINLIFDSFYRSSSTSGNAPGKGLGLTVVSGWWRRRAEDLGPAAAAWRPGSRPLPLSKRTRVSRTADTAQRRPRAEVDVARF